MSETLPVGTYDWRKSFNRIFGIQPKSQPLSWADYCKRMRAMKAEPTRETWLDLYKLNGWPLPEEL